MRYRDVPPKRAAPEEEEEKKKERKAEEKKVRLAEASSRPPMVEKARDGSFDGPTGKATTMTAPDPTILDLLGDPICVIEADYTISFANRALAELCGGRHRIVGRKCHEVVHRCPCPCADACLPEEECPHRRIFTTGETVRLRHEHRLANGERRYYDITASPALGADGRPVRLVQVMRDVTSEVQAERCLEETAIIEEVMATVGRLLLAGCDLHRISSLIMEEALRFTKSRQGCVAFQTLGQRRLTVLHRWEGKDGGQRREEIDDRHPLARWLAGGGGSLMCNEPQGIPPDLQLPGRPPLQRLLVVPVHSSERPIGLILLADAAGPYSAGDRRFLERLADLYGLALVRCRQEIQIERAKQEWERTFDAIQDVVTLQDDEMRIIRANRATSRIFGMEPAEIIGRSCHELFRGSPDPCPECPVAEVLGQGKNVTAQVFHEKLGKTFLVSLSPIEDEHGDITGFAHFARDITTEKHLEAQLRQAQKMEAVGRLAGGVAHDFNNVLTVIQGFLGVAEQELDPDSRARMALEQVKEGARRGADLVRQLLLFSRKKSMERQPVDCNRAIASLQKMIRRFIGEDITIETDLAADPAVVLGDPANIDQIVMNLAVNARDAMPDGGILTLATNRFTADLAYCNRHLDARPGEYVCITVSDTGIGMDPQTRERIFEPFFTTKEEGRGTGLGLAVVYGIVKEHGGWISCDSEPGNGAVFKVFLPAHGDTSQIDGGRTAAAAPTLARGHGERVLVIEDEEVVREFGATALGGNGYRVAVAATAAEARRLLAAGPFDLLFVDAVLPDGHGVELAEREVERRPATRVLVTSGYPDQGQQLWPVIHRHRWPFLQKPYTIETLLAAVARALRRTAAP